MRSLSANALPELILESVADLESQIAGESVARLTVVKLHRGTVEPVSETNEQRHTPVVSRICPVTGVDALTSLAHHRLYVTRRYTRFILRYMRFATQRTAVDDRLTRRIVARDLTRDERTAVRGAVRVLARHEISLHR